MPAPSPRELPWWEHPDCPDLDAPADDYLAELSRRVDALMARALNAEAEELVEIDHAGIDGWLESPSARDYLPIREED